MRTRNGSSSPSPRVSHAAGPPPGPAALPSIRSSRTSHASLAFEGIVTAITALGASVVCGSITPPRKRIVRSAKTDASLCNNRSAREGGNDDPLARRFHERYHDL